MRITLWSNIESFQPGNKADLDWAKSYAAGLRSLGHELSFGHPMRAQPLESDLIHVIGSGGWETLPVLAQRTKLLWISPGGFGGNSQVARRPESLAKHLLKMPWRMIRQRCLSVESERAWLRPVDLFIWPSSGRPGGWPPGRHETFPASPESAAALADRWLRAEAKIATPKS